MIKGSLLFSRGWVDTIKAMYTHLAKTATGASDQARSIFLLRVFKVWSTLEALTCCIM